MPWQRAGAAAAVARQKIYVSIMTVTGTSRLLGLFQLA